MTRDLLLTLTALTTALGVQLLFARSAIRLYEASRAWPIVFWICASVVTAALPIALGVLAGQVRQ